jgi:hypothetical protein
VTGELGRLRIDFPTTDELMPRLREKLREIEATLKADVARGRLALGGLLGNQRLRVYKDGRIEGSATLSPEMITAPRRTSEPRARVVAGGALRPVLAARAAHAAGGRTGGSVYGVGRAGHGMLTRFLVDRVSTFRACQDPASIA